MKSILFNTDMVCAIQEDRKTVTRRVVKGAGPDWDFVGIEKRPYERRVKADGSEYPKELDWPHAVFSAGDGYYDYPMIKTPCRPGDILYVRETWSRSMAGTYLYRATDIPFIHDRWNPSIHMPREAARIFLRVTDVRAERLQASFFDTGATVLACQKEGIDIRDECVECVAAYGSPCCIDSESECGILDEVRSYFSDLWDSTIKEADLFRYGWAANPWVWVIEFERCEKPGAAP